MQETLGITNTRHRSALGALERTPPTADKLTELVDAIYLRLAENWHRLRSSNAKPASLQNWRWYAPVPGIAPHNKSPEVVLERAILPFGLKSQLTVLAGQIRSQSHRVSSTPHSHRRSAIRSGVHRLDDNHFEFVELKVASDTPLFAALEIIQYGLVWLLSRQNRAALGYHERAMLDADAVDLTVLAPTRYYGQLDLSALAAGLDAGVRSVGHAHGGINLAFEFQEFSDSLLRSEGYSDPEACAVVNQRRQYLRSAAQCMQTEQALSKDLFLPGLPEDQIRAAYAAAPGNEIESGKFIANAESSAALVANAFGFFLNTPRALPPLPGCASLDWPATSVRLEAEVRFPWARGRHPWLDVLVETTEELVGIESKRFEPFRGRKKTSWSEAYWRDWGIDMEPYARLRDELHAGRFVCDRLDAGQLVKHAFGLSTAARRAPNRRGLFWSICITSQDNGRPAGL